MRNARMAVPVLGFFEVLIWIFAVGSAIRNMGSLWHVLGYASGFAVGNVVGLWLEEKLAMGLASIQIVSRSGGVELAGARIRSDGVAGSGARRQSRNRPHRGEAPSDRRGARRGGHL
jgi:uncharacterized protein YebE (UPF0316 family)